MAHLVSSFVASDRAYKPLESYYEEIREAQRCLSENGAEAFQRAALEKGECWGLGAKRIRVEFTTWPHPTLIDRDVEDQRFAEIVNQCATIERLLDAFGRWLTRRQRRIPHYSCEIVGRAKSTCVVEVTRRAAT